jgi:hypothetical protein
MSLLESVRAATSKTDVLLKEGKMQIYCFFMQFFGEDDVTVKDGGCYGYMLST